MHSECEVWLPRTRGDGPATRSGIPGVCMASPHTRGWTVSVVPVGADSGGFPAHAGMDPCCRPTCTARTRLPRTRGDGPRSLFAIPPVPMASPHTRGWTQRSVGASSCRAGFPAHAGMDPAECGGFVLSGRLPRTRGDGPSRCQPSRVSRMASPHTRGWTYKAGISTKDGAGFPAHAGMDPWDEVDEGVVSWASPHTRGWTPYPCTGTTEYLGFPAHAGMDPGAHQWLPHTGAASPHTRGWTPGGCQQDHPPRGFPAVKGGAKLDHGGGGKLDQPATGRSV